MILFLNIVVFLVFRVYNTVKIETKIKTNHFKKLCFLESVFCVATFELEEPYLIVERFIWKGSDDKWVSITLIA